MDSINNLLDIDRFKKKPTKKSTAHEWQNRALEIWTGLGSDLKKKSAVMRLVRRDRQKAEAVFRYMQEKGIKNVYYFFKVMNKKN